jgi:hypothetical protein
MTRSVKGAGAGRAQPRVAPAGEQPVLPGGRPRPGQFPGQPAQPGAAEPGPDTIRQGRGPVLTTHQDRSARPLTFPGPTRHNHPLRPRSPIAHHLVTSSQSRRSAGRQGVRAWSCPRSPRAFTVVLIGQEPGVRAVLADDRGSRSRGRNWPVRRGARRYARPVSRVSIVGVPSSAASYAAGQDLAPAALRSAGLPAKLIAAGLEVHDEGNLPVQVWKPGREHPLAQNAAQAARSLRQLVGRLGPVLARGDFALVLGGNCTIALGVMTALRRLEAGVPGLLYVDRHFDINTRTARPTAPWTGWAWPTRWPCRDACTPSPARSGPGRRWSHTRWPGSGCSRSGRPDGKREHAARPARGDQPGSGRRSSRCRRDRA